MNKLQLIYVSILSGILFAGAAYGGNCSSYRYMPGEICYGNIGGKLNILSTGSSELIFDDADEVLDALDEAKLNATAGIVSALSEMGSSFDVSKHDYNKQWVCKQSTNKPYVDDEHLHSILSGILVVGKCRSMDEIRVTVRYQQIIQKSDGCQICLGKFIDCHTKSCSLKRVYILTSASVFQHLSSELTASHAASTL